MPTRLAALVGALAASPAVWAATSNVDLYGTIDSLPTHETYSAAIDVASDFLTGGLYSAHSDIATALGGTASIAVSDPFGSGSQYYSASASTTLGSNHAYASATTFPLATLGTVSYSGWYDTVTIMGGSGTGTIHFTVQLNGTVDAGAISGLAGYGLYASSMHPTQLANGYIIDYAPLPTNPWFLLTSEVTPIAGHTIGVSPYNDTSLVFTTEILPPVDVMGIPVPPQQILVDQVLAPGAGQSIDVTLHGTLTFTYGEAFYLISDLGMGVGGIETFCAFTIDGTCSPPPVDGTGATTLDFSNSANLINITLPDGATASFASGASYNVTAVPEPGEWAMLLAGLGLVAWRARRRAA